MTVYWVVWDAAAHWVVDRLERRGALPSVTELRARGVFGAGRPARPNCQTPPSLATLWTGSWPWEHGVTGFTVPGGGGTGTFGHTSGFSAEFPRVPTVWSDLAAHGRRSAFAHVPWVFDGAGRTDGFVDAAVEAYSSRSARHAVLPVEPDAAYDWDIGGHRVRVETTPRGALVRTSAREGTPVPEGIWSPVWLGRGDSREGTWITCLRSGGRTLLVHTGVWRPRVAGTNTPLVERLRECPPFAGEGVGPLYRAGTFGSRLADGGDGRAEEVFLSSVECVARSFGAAADAVMEEHEADLVVVYLPMTDDVGHELLGLCDPHSAAHRPDVSERVWEFLTRCYGWADGVLGRVLARAGAADTVVLSADHGMVGGTHLVHLNDALVQAGLARTDSGGALDPQRSAVLYHPANNGSLWANPEAGGGRSPSDAMGEALAVLSELTDPGTGARVVSGFLDERGQPLRLDTPPPSPVFVSLADDYQPSSACLGTGQMVVPTPKTGAHVVNTGSSRLHAVVGARGPGLEPGTDLGVVDNTLPAALVRRQLAPPHTTL